MKLGLHMESSSITLVKKFWSLPRKKVLCQLKRWYGWWMSSTQAGVTGKMDVVITALSVLCVHVDCSLIVVVLLLVMPVAPCNPLLEMLTDPSLGSFPMAACQLVCRLRWFLGYLHFSHKLPPEHQNVYFFLSPYLTTIPLEFSELSGQPVHMKLLLVGTPSKVVK